MKTLHIHSRCLVYVKKCIHLAVLFLLWLKDHILMQKSYLFFSFPLPFLCFPLSKLSLQPARLSRLIECSQFSSLSLLVCPSAWPGSMHVFVWNVVNAVFPAALNVLNAVFSMANVFMNIVQFYPGHSSTWSLHWSTVSRCLYRCQQFIFHSTFWNRNLHCQDSEPNVLCHIFSQC